MQSTISDKGLISRIYKEPLNSTTKKANNPIQNRAKTLKRHFSKDDLKVTSKHVKKVLASTDDQGNANQTIVSDHLAPGGMATIKTTESSES